MKREIFRSARHFSILWKNPAQAMARFVHTQVQLVGPTDSKKRAAIITSSNDKEISENARTYYDRSKSEIIEALTDVVLDQGEREGLLLSAITTVHSPAEGGGYQTNPGTHCLASYFRITEEGGVKFDPETIIDFHSNPMAPKKAKDIKHQGIVLKGQNYSVPGVHGKREARIFRFLSDPGCSMQQHLAPLISIVLPASLLTIDLEEIKKIVTHSRQDESRAQYDRMRNSCAHKVLDLLPYANKEEKGLLPIRAISEVAQELCNCPEISDMIEDTMGPYLVGPVELYKMLSLAAEEGKAQSPKP